MYYGRRLSKLRKSESYFLPFNFNLGRPTDEKRLGHQPQGHRGRHVGGLPGGQDKKRTRTSYGAQPRVAPEYEDQLTDVEEVPGSNKRSRIPRGKFVVNNKAQPKHPPLGRPPLEIPAGPWQHISTDYIVLLPISRGHDAIQVYNFLTIEASIISLSESVPSPQSSISVNWDTPDRQTSPTPQTQKRTNSDTQASSPKRRRKTKTTSSYLLKDVKKLSPKKKGGSEGADAQMKGFGATGRVAANPMIPQSSNERIRPNWQGCAQSNYPPEPK
ncbi:hypothetical protein B0H14DRAFT_2582841 [Mycena olivaceomarginata]|nr:hypothetical protein B0H14DRAFT_2582841 [Mycena olivaceomarginata]